MDTQNHTNPHHFPLPQSTHFSLPYHGFARLCLSKTKNNTVNFDEDLCGLHKWQSDTEFWAGLLKYAEGFDLAAKLGFLFFSFEGTFLHKTNRCCSSKKETNFENQKWNDQWPPTPKTNSESLLWVFKNEMRFLLHKSPNQNGHTQRNVYFWGATRVIPFRIRQSPI